MSCVPTPGELFGWRSYLASLFEKSFAVASIAANVAARSPNCRQPFNMDALPMSVSPAKQKSRWTQNTCSEDCPISTSGRTARGFNQRCPTISTAATAAKSRSHQSWVKAYDEPKLFPWLFSKSLATNPK
jgi:hypothetical protein